MKHIEALIIRRVVYGEAHDIVTLATDRIGKISAIASHARKQRHKLFGKTALLTCGIFSLVYKETLSKLYDVSVDETFFSLAYHYEAYGHALYFCELMDRLLPAHGHSQRLYTLLSMALRLLQKGMTPVVVRTVYEHHLTRYAGFGLHLKSCVLCGTKKGIYGLSADAGGFICHACPVGDRYALTKKSASLLCQLDKMTLAMIETWQPSIDDITLLATFYTYFLHTVHGFRVKSWSVLQQKQ